MTSPDAFWPPIPPGGEPLPKPTAHPPFEMPNTEEDLRGILCNPNYAGLNEYPRLVSDEMWTYNAIRMIEEDGAAQFCVNLMHVLRHTQARQALPKGSLPRWIIVVKQNDGQMLQIESDSWCSEGFNTAADAEKALKSLDSSPPGARVVSTDRVVWDDELGAAHAQYNGELGE